MEQWPLPERVPSSTVRFLARYPWHKSAPAARAKPADLNLRAAHATASTAAMVRTCAGGLGDPEQGMLGRIAAPGSDQQGAGPVAVQSGGVDS